MLRPVRFRPPAGSGMPARRCRRRPAPRRPAAAGHAGRRHPRRPRHRRCGRADRPCARAADRPARSARGARPGFSRIRPSTRNAASWDTSRSRYRNTPRPIPKARTATTATIRYSTGGCCAARAINQADVAISATAQPDARAPTIGGTEQPARGRRAPAARAAATAGGGRRPPASGGSTTRPTCRCRSPGPRRGERLGAIQRAGRHRLRQSAIGCFTCGSPDRIAGRTGQPSARRPCRPAPAAPGGG